MVDIESLYRQQYGALLAEVITRVGLPNLPVAEKIVENVFDSARRDWKDGGHPENQSDWLYSACRNAMAKYFSDKSGELSENLSVDLTNDGNKDRILSLLFACCDGRHSPRTQVMLILNIFCGLSVDDIAAALSVASDRTEQSLQVGRKELMSHASLILPMGAESAEKLSLLHTCVFVMFSTGYSATSNDSAARRDLCVLAMKVLNTILGNPARCNHDTFALMAWMCFQSSRFEARAEVEGDLVELELQDRTLWDKELIRLGIQYLKQAHDSNETSRFVYYAAIASMHSVAETFAGTNWQVLSGLYERLSEISSSPVDDVNHSMAVFYAKGPREALITLNQSRHRSWFSGYRVYHALLGKISESMNEGIEAIHHFETALNMTTLNAERTYLEQKIVSLKVSMN